MVQTRMTFFFKTYLFLERGEGREKGREISVSERYLLPLIRPTTRDLACNSGMCPDWESNQQPFSSQAGTQSIKPHQPGEERLLRRAELSSDSFLSLTYPLKYIYNQKEWPFFGLPSATICLLQHLPDLLAIICISFSFLKSLSSQTQDFLF